jgi:pimeloyl-ACP methyl ester carboxylesterase
VVEQVQEIAAPVAQTSSALEPVKLERKVLDIDSIPFPVMVGGSGPPVLLLHLPVNPMHVYKKTMPGLAEHHRVYTVDIRPLVSVWFYEGHSTLLRFVTEYLTKLMDRLELKQADVVASFMGGGIAMSLAIRHPERIRKLVLISSLGQFTVPRSWVFWMIFFFINLPGMRMMFDMLMVSPRLQRWVLNFDRKLFGKIRVAEFFFRDPEEGVDFHLEQLYDGLSAKPNPFSFETFVNVIRHLRYGEIKYLIPTIRHPTLLLYGEQDILCPQKKAENLRRALRRSKLVMIPETRVFLHWEAAGEVNRRIIEFLKE